MSKLELENVIYDTREDLAYTNSMLVEFITRSLIGNFDSDTLTKILTRIGNTIDNLNNVVDEM